MKSRKIDREIGGKLLLAGSEKRDLVGWRAFVSWRWKRRMLDQSVVAFVGWKGNRMYRVFRSLPGGAEAMQSMDSADADWILYQGLLLAGDCRRNTETEPLE